eukprot:1084559-Rhodomonas_salina.2
MAESSVSGPRVLFAFSSSNLMPIRRCAPEGLKGEGSKAKVVQEGKEGKHREGRCCEEEAADDVFGVAAL